MDDVFFILPFMFATLPLFVIDELRPILGLPQPKKNQENPPFPVKIETKERPKVQIKGPFTNSNEVIETNFNEDDFLLLSNEPQFLPQKEIIIEEKKVEVEQSVMSTKELAEMTKSFMSKSLSGTLTREENAKIKAEIDKYQAHLAKQQQKDKAQNASPQQKLIIEKETSAEETRQKEKDQAAEQLRRIQQENAKLKADLMAPPRSTVRAASDKVEEQKQLEDQAKSSTIQTPIKIEMKINQSKQANLNNISQPMIIQKPIPPKNRPPVRKVPFDPNLAHPCQVIDAKTGVLKRNVEVDIANLSRLVQTIPGKQIFLHMPIVFTKIASAPEETRLCQIHGWETFQQGPEGLMSTVKYDICEIDIKTGLEIKDRAPEIMAGKINMKK